MIIINNGDEDVNDFSLSHYQESLQGYSSGTDILTGTQYNSLNHVSLKANTAYIIQLQK